MKDVKSSNQESGRGVKIVRLGKTDKSIIAQLQVAWEEIVEDSAAR